MEKSSLGISRIRHYVALRPLRAVNTIYTRLVSFNVHFRNKFNIFITILISALTKLKSLTIFILNFRNFQNYTCFDAKRNIKSLHNLELALVIYFSQTVFSILVLITVKKSQQDIYLFECLI